MQSCMNKVRQSDLFGVPVNLTYKGEESFRTFMGGLISILFVIASIIYFGVVTKSMWLDP